MTVQPSWLMTWLDSEHISDTAGISRALRDPFVQTRLKATMEAVPYSAPRADVASRAPLAAGSGFDLAGGPGTCLAAECLIRDVDNLVRRTWHYFDEILMAGPSAYRLRRLFSSDPELAIETLESYAQVLLHIREIGAEQLLSFGEKRPPCSEHLLDHAREAQMTDLVLQSADQWIDKIIGEAEIGLDFDGWSDECGHDHWGYVVNHPHFEHTRHGVLAAPGSSDLNDLRRLTLHILHNGYISTLIADVNFARMTNAALGTGTTIHEELMEERTRSTPSEAAVAYDLPLPYMAEIDPKLLLAAKEDYIDSFDRFRGALRSSIIERLSAQQGTSVSATDIALEIGRDVIDPALREISVDVNKANDTFRRMGGLSASVALVFTTVGLLSVTPALIGASAGAVVAATDIRSYLASKDEVKHSEMYFLWRLMREHHRR